MDTDGISENDIPLPELRDLMAQNGFDDLTLDQYARLDDVVFTEGDTEFNEFSKMSDEKSEGEAETEEEFDDENCEHTDGNRILQSNIQKHWTC